MGDHVNDSGFINSLNGMDVESAKNFIRSLHHSGLFNFEEKNTAGLTLLQQTLANNSDVEIIEALLDAGADPAPMLSPSPATFPPLYMAANLADARITNSLLQALRRKYKDDDKQYLKKITEISPQTLKSAFDVAQQNQNARARQLITASISLAIEELLPDFTSWGMVTLQETHAIASVKKAGLRERLYEIMVDEVDHQRVAIIGCGFAGTLAAIHLIKHAQKPLEIMMIEENEKQRGGGVGFGANSNDPYFLTNISNKTMSSFPVNRIDLADWLNNKADRTEWPEIWQSTIFTAHDACPRMLFQLYMQYNLQLAQKEAEDNGKLVAVTEISGKVVHIFDQEDQPTRIIFSSGESVAANMAILATGFVAAKKPAFSVDKPAAQRTVFDPYTPQGKEQITHIDKDSTLLIVGGLQSAADQVVRLIYQGHQGKIIMCSRSGHEHEPYPALGIEAPFKISRPAFMDADNIPDFIQGLRADFWERTKIEEHSAERVIQAYQPFIPEVIEKFGQKAVGQLLNQHRSLINSLRVGINHKVARILKKAEISGQLQHMAGHIHRCEAAEQEIFVSYTPKGQEEATALAVDHMIICLGRQTLAGPLWENMLQSGMARPHFTGDGVQVDAYDGALIKANGKASTRLFVVGALRAGSMLENSGLIGPPAASVPGTSKAIFSTAVQIKTEMASTYAHETVEAAILSKNATDDYLRNKGLALQPQQTRSFRSPAP
ncbi:MAG: FAD/NAD(P)-binding protein [Alphaproteobacteria bacterium]